MSASIQPPTDLELMQLADDELDEARTEELGDELSDDARDKLAALALAGELLAERADDDDRADGLADSIMAKIERDELPELEDRDSPEHASPEHPSSEEQASELELQRPDVPATKSAAPANDNARRIFVLAAMAAAVAAGLMFWGRTDPGPELATRGRPPATAPTPAPSPAPAATGAVPNSGVAELEPVDNDAVPVDQPGVEVAAVDFGNPGGAVFYVEGAADEPKTTVVWVTDEVGDD